MKIFVFDEDTRYVRSELVVKGAFCPLFVERLFQSLSKFFQGVLQKIVDIRGDKAQHHAQGRSAKGGMACEEIRWHRCNGFNNIHDCPYARVFHISFNTFQGHAHFLEHLFRMNNTYTISFYRGDLLLDTSLVSIAQLGAYVKEATLVLKQFSKSIDLWVDYQTLFVSGPFMQGMHNCTLSNGNVKFKLLRASLY